MKDLAELLAAEGIALTPEAFRRITDAVARRLREEESAQDSNGKTDEGKEGQNQSSDNSESRARPKLEPWKERFLAEMVVSANVTKACKAANVSRDIAYLNRGSDVVFATAWDNAKLGKVDAIEERALDLALAGEPRLIEFVLKALKRAEFGDKLGIEVSGSVTHAHLHVAADQLADRAKDLLPWLAEKRAKVLGAPKTVDLPPIP